MFRSGRSGSAGAAFSLRERVTTRCSGQRQEEPSAAADLERWTELTDLDTLILLKTRAGGVQDMLDVAQLIWRHPDRLPLARDLADRYGVRPRLESCLTDRRERQRYLDSVPRSARAQRRAEIDRLIPLP
jgi:hypothetical protein